MATFSITTKLDLPSDQVWASVSDFTRPPSPVFTRNAPRPQTRRELVSVVVSGCWMGTKVDSSIRVIHLHLQTNRRIHLQAMFSRKVNGDWR